MAAPAPAAAAAAAAPAAGEARPSFRRDALLDIERSVQQKWEEAQIFQADAKDAATRKLDDKFLATFPYPYSQSRSAQSDATRRDGTSAVSVAVPLLLRTGSWSFSTTDAHGQHHGEPLC